MLIKWDCAIAELTAMDPSLIREVAAELVRAHRRGHHLVVISRPIVDWLINLGGLSQLEVSTLTRIKHEFTQNGNVYRQSKIYIKLLCSSTDIIDVVNECISISLPKFLKSNIADKPKLVIENSTRDGWMYSFILNNTRDRFGCRHVEIDLVHGGGDDVVNVFSQLVTEERVVCSIVDSDKHAPCTAKNTKLSRLNTVIGRHKWPLAFAGSPPCREIENLIPFELIRALDCAYGKAESAVLLRIVEAEIKNGAQSDNLFLSYFDFKEGLTPKKLEKKDDNERDWILSKIQLGGLPKDGCKIGGYGLNIVDQLKRDDKHVASMRSLIRTNAWMEVFGAFFVGIIWVFASNRKIFT